jgi:hypothetical protein
VHIAPAYVGSNHFWSYVSSLSLYFCKKLFLVLRTHDLVVYLVGYILCIVDSYICRDIFDRINIMYCKLLYVSEGVLPLKTFIL